jgi:transcription-repair coupling factor (superfamily II helicase)
MPKEVTALIDISLLKSMLEKLCICDVVDKTSKIGFSFCDDGSFNIDVLATLVREYKRKIRIPNQSRPYFEYHFRKDGISEREKLEEINNVIKKVYKEYV